MLGMVFTEFLDMVEERFSPEVADAIIVDAELPHGGSYTAVGYYPHEEIVRLVGELSRRTNTPAAELVKAFGHHLIGRFRSRYPALFESSRSLFDFLAAVDGEIHREVHKLYPEARLPRLKVLARSADHLELAYLSPRSMEPLAEGLITGAMDHFDEPCAITLETRDQADGRPVSVFVLDRTHAA